MLVAPPAPPRLVGVDRCVALFAYEGAGREVVSRLKFANHRDAVRPLGSALAAAIDQPVDVVTWVPTSGARRHHRGYDQAELLARAVGRALGVPARSTLAHRGGAAQTGRSRADRSRARFVAARRLPSGTVVALVDDVRTTGASLSAAARALRSAGAGSVVAATLAATPCAESGRWSLPGRTDDPLQSG